MLEIYDYFNLTVQLLLLSATGNIIRRSESPDSSEIPVPKQLKVVRVKDQLDKRALRISNIDETGRRLPGGILFRHSFTYSL